MTDEAERLRLTRIYAQLRDRLLDLSLRNPMLSYKHRATSKRQLQIVDEVPEEVYRLLTDESTTLEIVALPEPDHIPKDERTEEFVAALEHAKVADLEYQTKLQALESTGRDDEFEVAKVERELRDRVREQLELPPRLNRKTINPSDHARELGIDPNVELRPARTKPEHRDRKLQTLKWPDSLDATLEKLSDEARLAEQETGLSTLFLVFGFLEWSEREDSGKKLFAPLLLLPVHLEKTKKLGRKTVFSLSATAGTADVNLSLQKKMERDFRRGLPEMEDDEGGAAPVEKYFAAVAKAIEGLNGWHVRRWLTLGHFAFGRFAMYSDLDPKKWNDNPVGDELVGAIVRGTEILGDGGSSLLSPPDDYPIDEPEIESVAPILIHDADASQHSALVDVMKGKHLVIQGPPGTGKSQTITNVIANTLAAGRTVLFLAEKQAALEVVKRRLDKAGIGEFCLELHSDRATPRLVIESLKTRYKLASGPARRSRPGAPDPMWQQSRRELGSYASALNSPAEDGRTPFDMIWRALRSRTEAGEHLEAFRRVSIPQDLIADAAAFERAAGEMAIYADIAQQFEHAFGPPSHSPWSALRFADDVNSSVAFGLVDDLSLLTEDAEALAELLKGTADLGVREVADLEALMGADRTLPPRAPESSIITAVCRYEPAEIALLVALKVELRRLSGEPREDVAGEAAAAFDIADAVAPHAAALGLGHARPSDIYQEAAAQVERSNALAEALDAALPSVSVIRAEDTFPCDGLNAVVIAAFTATRVAADLAPWFSWQPAGGPQAFEKARAEWASLVDTEARWRGRFSSYRESVWPSPDELLAAAAVAKKRGLAAFLGSVGGRSKLVASMAQRLGLPADAKVSAEELEAVASHARELAAFLENRGYRQMLGSSWAGLDTPFETIAKGLKFAATARTKIAEFPHGARVCELLDELDPDGLKRLAATFPALEPLRRIFQERPASIPSAPIQQLIANLRDAVSASEAILSADPERTLARFDLPLEELRRAFAFERERRHVISRLLGHPLSALAELLAGSDEAVEGTSAASSWKGAVEALAMPEPVRNALLSEHAAGARERVAEVARAASARLTALRDRIGSIARDRGTSGFDASKPVDLVRVAADLIARRDELTMFLSLREQRATVGRLGLEPFLACAEEAGLTPSLMHPLLTGLVSQRRAEQVRRTDPVLSRAAGARIEASRNAFIERDRRKIEADRETVRGMLAPVRPPNGQRYGSRKEWTEASLLENEFSKEKRFVPVRELMRRAGTSVQVMKPCFMMSPLSLAKFVPAGRLKFDLVVIDEASQMKPEDALGGLLRAKQLVVVGDQKQLPPTDFFSRSGATAADDEDFEDVDDESILEACQKTFRQVRLLRWHYRSRCESLIWFSNKEFYRGELITFPMARPGSFSVELVRVDGAFEARRNPAEAQTVAEQAIEFMRSFADADEEQIPTLGIVAVNTDQRDLIYEEIRRLQADDEAVERYREKVSNKGEPLFVKNLENVQGDERDFIFISLTYGPKPGRTEVMQRFGPINGKQGHRRLNVLFSRARNRIGLFTSMGSVDVKPTETSSEGVHVLKRYLEYAETQGRAPVTGVGPEPDSDFEIEVADRLRSRGYKVDLQVGVSGFKIDLGVRHPDHPERFLAGIECDGARYHSSKSARDRDRLREDILQSLGWDILRVWSTDWFDNANLQTERLVKSLEELRTRPLATFNDYRIARSPESIRDLASVAPEHGPDHLPSEEASAAPESVETAEEQPPCAQPQTALTGDGPLTEAELYECLYAFRDTVVEAEMEPWERHRSILRDGLIETFVAQRLAEPDDWFRKVPQYQRSGTNPVEKARYLERICDLVARLEGVPRARVPMLGSEFKLTSPQIAPKPTQGHLFGSSGRTESRDDAITLPQAVPVPATPLHEREQAPGAGRPSYAVADVSACGFEPNPDRFYEASYVPALRAMVSHVIATEGPIYFDQLVTRIARAHGFLRNGGTIVDAVSRAAEPRFPRTKEAGKDLYWPEGADTRAVLPLRNGEGDVRDHFDIPLAELASLAVPLLAIGRSTEEIVNHMKEHFSLGRLREPARQRFEAAIEIARSRDPSQML